ncbi:oligomeric golgi complex component, COG2-domain-containing protein [Amylocarpus encephaloides]|uniref:Conserved oligomeric Golgi complex subunit 2 n=1 Tax=Amylocarpus encephaloides TaxID=45428 RepID=A0A9P8C6D7_9HELO|nr:oligomeric golgi complex component, COG2-domain-containing protein [Amylocarpus encephaloides]
MSKFYFGGGSENLSSDDEDNLPYPEALPRSDFLVPDFDAPTYLSTLSDRHQTLEDLRTDLRERSQALSKELLDLVNTNYEQFLSLGSDLLGGEEKVEDVRVGLLGFKRGVEGVKTKVKERKLEVDGLLGEKKDVSKQISMCRKLLEVDARLEELEDKLMVSSLGRSANEGEHESWTDSEDEDEDDDLSLDAGVAGTSPKKLQRLVTDCLHVERLINSVGEDHPFVAAQQSRMLRVRNTILLDLNTSLKQATSGGEDGKLRLIKILGVYRAFGAESEALRILKDLKSK